MSDNQNKQAASISSQLLGVLGVLFIILKLAGVISWSWWLVTMPFWFGLAVALVIVLGFAVCVFGVATIAWLLDKFSGGHRYGRRW